MEKSEGFQPKLFIIHYSSFIIGFIGTINPNLQILRITIIPQKFVRYPMKTAGKRLSAALLALLMLISAAACTGSEDPTDTTGSNTPADSTPNAEVTTEEVTLPAPEDYEITEKDGTASVTTPLGLTYTLTGYTALDKATATVGESLTYTLEGEAFEEKFNRITLTYAATAPVKVWVER